LGHKIGGRGRSRSTDFQPRLALQKDRLRAVFLLNHERRLGVSMMPGLTAFTRMPRVAMFRASDRHKPITPPLDDTLDRDRPGFADDLAERAVCDVLRDAADNVADQARIALR
jgi:hypothetical protein